VRALRASITPIAWALILMATFAGCMSQREKALRAAFVTVNSLRNGFTDLSRDRQQQIVDAAKSPEEGQAALTAFRTERDKVMAAFDDVYRALTAAVVANDTPSLTAAQTIVKRLTQAYDELKKVKSP